MEIFVTILMFILGACFGSFLCCQARRLNLKRKGTKKLSRRSVCLACKHQLKWYDNIPILSWLILGGKCRKCHKKIGLLEFLSELGVGLAFALIFLSILGGNSLEYLALEFMNHPINYAIVALALVLILSLSFLAIYDGAYGELPSLCLIIAVICAVIFTILRQWNNSSTLLASLIDPLFSVLVLSGTYLILYLVSKGKWVGDGDWILALSIALILGHPFLALVTLFLSNFLACLVMFPIVKKSKNHKIYFGPFLVAAFVVVFCFQNFLLNLIAV